jgi:predicted HTH transcriptional regulator
MPSRLSREQLATMVETQAVEFKKSLKLRKEGMTSLAAMVNADGANGMILFGVESDGTPCGVEPGDLDKAQRTLAQHMGEKFDPRLIAKIELKECDGRMLLSVSAHRAAGVSYHEYDGRAYIREGSTNRSLSVAEKAQLNSRRRRDLHTGPWKCDGCQVVAGMVLGMETTASGVQKSYRCDCGGEFWPI